MMKDTVLDAPAFGGFSAAEPNEVAVPRRSKRKLREAERREFKVALFVLFSLFLVIAIASRLLPRGWRPLSGPGGEARSVLGEARAAANEITPFLFSR